MDKNQKELLAVLYKQQRVPLDSLPYTPEFDTLCKTFNNMGVCRSHASNNTIWLELMGLRKRGLLPVKRESKASKLERKLSGDTATQGETASV